MVTPQDFCDEILRSVHTSNLHFLVQESPFSLYITLRKKFATQPQVTEGAKVESDSELTLARDTIKVLEDKAAHAESEFSKECNKLKVKKEQFSEEIKILKESLKNSQAETCEKKKVISEVNKSVKAKDKELYNLEKKCNTATDTIKQLRDKVAELNKYQGELARSEKDKDEKGKISNDKLEKKVKTLEKKLSSLNTNSNNNNNADYHVKSLPSVSLSVTPSSATSTSNLPTPTLTPAPTIPVLPEAAPFSPIVSPSSNPALVLPTTHPSTPNSRPSVQSPGRPNSSYTPPGTPPPRLSASAANELPQSPRLCQHTTQCVKRQPKPPPPEKSSVLVHMGSRYHEHFQAGPHGFPARYGPHDSCIAVDHHNYGCSDCIWYKRWGELHGFPDLYPWKYVGSGKYSDQDLKQIGN